jgi:hypothetical protein
VPENTICWGFQNSQTEGIALFPESLHTKTAARREGTTHPQSPLFSRMQFSQGWTQLNIDSAEGNEEKEHSFVPLSLL